MEIHQLRYLVLVAEELSFTRAAARANVAQPALSRQIRKLEDELGAPLVDRTTRNVRMTDVGAQFVERARAILDDLDDARASVQRSAQLLSGRVTIGMTATPGPIDVPGLLAGFRDRYPGVDLALREDLSVHLTERLRRDELDLAFITDVEPAERQRLDMRLLASEELCLIVAADHPLAGRASVAIKSLRQESFVAFPRGATIRRAFEAAAARAGFEPRVAFESTDIARGRALVSRGLGVALLPRSDAEAAGPPVEAVALRDGGLEHHVFVATRTGRRLSAAAAAFLHTIDT